MASHLTLLTLSVLTVFLFLATIPKGGDAVKCYVCNSMNISEGGCADEFKKSRPNDENFLKDCGPEQTFCRKQYQNIFGNIRVVRSCGHYWDDNKGEGDCLGTNSEDVRLLSCQCKGDECNAAAWPVASMMTMLIPSLLLLFTNL